MDIVPISTADIEAVAPLVADFRVTLRALKGRHTGPDEGAARKELSSYLAAGFPCFQAVANGQACGYLVCRIDDDCVFVESLYTRPDHRRQGVASTLLQKAEELCSAPRDSTLYFWVQPQQRKNVSLSCAPRLHGAESGRSAPPAPRRNAFAENHSRWARI